MKGAGGFHFRMAVVFLAVAVIGFAPTYWVPLLRGRLELPPILHLHALFFYGWMGLYLRQTWLVASGEVARHRELGVAGVALATGMCFAGLGAAVSSLKQAEAGGDGAQGRAFSIVAVTAALMFGGLVAAAIVKVKQPEAHKRLMLVATASMLQAAVGRWFILLLAPEGLGAQGGVAKPPQVALTILPGMVADLLIVAGMLHDRRSRGRVHPVYWVAGGCVLAVQVLRAPVSQTGAWRRVTDWLLAMAP